MKNHYQAPSIELLLCNEVDTLLTSTLDDNEQFSYGWVKDLL